MSDLLKAIKNIIENPIKDIKAVYKSKNRANNMGDALEEYVKDCFTNTFDEESEVVRNKEYSSIFSYLGNQNNPPDMILKNSDAIEVKKIESDNSAIALNSSYPKAILDVTNPMLTTACKQCEDWKQKDIIYLIGTMNKSVLKRLWIVYGNCYAADAEVYEKLKHTITAGVEKITDVEFSETKELGKVKKVDPLGITDLRIRGMWDIENPNKVFNYICKTESNKNLELYSLMLKTKYDSFSKESRDIIQKLVSEKKLVKENVEIKNPNNPARLLESILIRTI